MNEANQNVKIEEVSPVKKKLSFEIPWEETRKALDEVYRKISKTAKVKGFRQGKIPRPLLEKHYKEYAEEETMTNLFNQYFWDALKNNDIEAISRPEIDQHGIEAEKDFAFSATVEIEPAFDPEGYIGLEVEREEMDVTDADVEAKMMELQEMHSTMEDASAEDEISNGKYVVIDFQGTLDGHPMREMKADDYLLEIGSGSFIPGFEDQLIGMKKGEVRDITVNFPEDYHHKEVAGRDVVFSVALKNIKEKKLPDINEEFVKNFDQFNSLTELKEELRKTIEKQKIDKINSDMKMSIISSLLEKNDFPAPDSLVEMQISSMMADARWRMSMQGIDPEKAAKILPQYHDLYKKDATRIVRTLLLMKKIAAKENISVNDEEIAGHVKEMADDRGQSYESYRESLENGGMLEGIREELKSKKVMDLIEAKAIIRSVQKAPATTEEVK